MTKPASPMPSPAEVAVLRVLASAGVAAHIARGVTPQIIRALEPHLAGAVSRREPPPKRPLSAPPGVCAVWPRCNRPAKTRGMCPGHYMRWHIHGAVDAERAAARDAAPHPPRRTRHARAGGRDHRHGGLHLMDIRQRIRVDRLELIKALEYHLKEQRAEYEQAKRDYVAAMKSRRRAVANQLADTAKRVRSGEIPDSALKDSYTLGRAAMAGVDNLPTEPAPPLQLPAAIRQLKQSTDDTISLTLADHAAYFGERLK